VKRMFGGISEGVEVDGMLWAKQSRSRVKRSSNVKGKAVEVMTCSRGEAIEGALHKRRRALSIGGIEDLKCASGKNLLSVERAVRTHDIYIGARCAFIETRRSFFQARHGLFQMRDACLVRRVILLPNGRCALITRIALLFPMGNTWVPNGRRALISCITL
jgi:hypothetical protein